MCRGSADFSLERLKSATISSDCIVEPIMRSYIIYMVRCTLGLNGDRQFWLS
jgi:hypothetical protein